MMPILIVEVILTWIRRAHVIYESIYNFWLIWQKCA